MMTTISNRAQTLAFAVLASLAISTRALAGCPVALQGQPNTAAQSLSISKLSQLMVCRTGDALNDTSPCNTFAGRGLDAIYGVTDFKSGDGYLTANGIADYLASSSQWAALGALFDADNNLCAQALANKAYPVVAVLKGAEHGHIALVIPGDLGQSGSWGFSVVNSASFRLNEPGKAYVNGKISLAFSPENAKNALLYYRRATVPGT